MPVPLSTICRFCSTPMPYLQELPSIQYLPASSNYVIYFPAASLSPISFSFYQPPQPAMVKDKDKITKEKAMSRKSTRAKGNLKRGEKRTTRSQLLLHCQGLGSNLITLDAKGPSNVQDLPVDLSTNTSLSDVFPTGDKSKTSTAKSSPTEDMSVSSTEDDSKLSSEKSHMSDNMSETSLSIGSTTKTQYEFKPSSARQALLLEKFSTLLLGNTAIMTCSYK